MPARFALSKRGELRGARKRAGEAVAMASMLACLLASESLWILRPAQRCVGHEANGRQASRCHSRGVTRYLEVDTG